MKKITKLVAAGALTFSATLASASTILSPTDGDVNFLTSSSFIENNLSLAIFDDTEAVAGGSPIVSSTGILEVTLHDGFLNDGGVIDFLGNVGTGGAYQASNQVDLYDFPIDPSNDNFIVGLGITTGAGTVWYADSGFIPGPANNGTLIWDLGGTLGVVAVDVQVIPVPAAVWLFGTGLLGLVGVARRRA